MNVVAIAGKYQQQPSAGFDDTRLPLEDDFTTGEPVIQIIDRRDIALGCVIGNPITSLALPTIVRVSAMSPAGTHRGEDQCFRIKRVRQLQDRSNGGHASPKKPRKNVSGVWRIPHIVAIDNGMSCAIHHIRQVGVLVVEFHQQTAIGLADRTLDFGDHSRGAACFYERLPSADSSARLDGNIEQNMKVVNREGAVPSELKPSRRSQPGAASGDA